MYPWLDRSGRLAPFKLLVFIGLFLPGAWTAVNFALGNLGPRPLTEAIHDLGLWAIRFLFISLAVTPFRQLLQWPQLIQVRRMIGVAAFAYALTHLVFYAASEAFDLKKVVLEIILRFYLTIGFVALLGLSALAVTSTDGMVKRLGGRRWRRLHQLSYGIGVLASIHFFLQVKANVGEPMVMAGLFVWLMGYRAMTAWLIKKPPVPIWSVGLLGVASGAVTMLGEAVYYWLKRGVDPLRVLHANLTLDIGMRPGLVVLAIALAVTAAALLRSTLKRGGRLRLASAGE
jgi:sulfoxide reductase heme-binding subunit YedZ